MESLFLSHSHDDAALAEVLTQLVENCFPGHIQVKVSSAAPSEGGIAAGSEWPDWINDQVRSSMFTAVLLTPNSLNKPWLMWEAGAVSGVSLAMGKPSAVIPIVYRLSMEQVPSPLRSRQAALGEDGNSIIRVLETLKQSLSHLPERNFRKFVDDSVPPYLKEVSRVLADTPPPLTESAIHEWLDRISYFERSDRRSEIHQLHRAMVNVFAPGDNAFKTPLDVRLHRRLGDIYLFAKRPVEASEQYELALRLYPRDIFLMHKLGLALLEAGEEASAEKILNSLLEIDADAIKWSTEVAGLKGRLFWHRYQRTEAESDLLAARDAYAEGLKHNEDSHYMADNVGQLSLLLGEEDRAREAFRRGLAALTKTDDRGYWAMATRASCHLGLGERTEGLAALRQVATLCPEPAVFDSIRRGLARLHKGLRGTDEERETWRKTLDGTEGAHPDAT